VSTPLSSRRAFCGKSEFGKMVCLVFNGVVLMRLLSTQSTSQQKNLLKEFKNITGAKYGLFVWQLNWSSSSDKQATDLLKGNGWDLNSAMDAFYQKNPSLFLDLLL
jgi:hypothetical protein